MYVAVIPRESPIHNIHVYFFILLSGAAHLLNQDVIMLRSKHHQLTINERCYSIHFQLKISYKKSALQVLSA